MALGWFSLKGFRMTRFFIKDADAAVTAIDCFASFCMSAAAGDTVKAAFDLATFLAALQNTGSAGGFIF